MFFGSRNESRVLNSWNPSVRKTSWIRSMTLQSSYWPRIAEKYGLNLTVVNNAVDPTFRFMTVDHDGKIRMDCSSPSAMASLVRLKDKFRIAFGSDPDADRHG